MSEKPSTETTAAMVTKLDQKAAIAALMGTSRFRGTAHLRGLAETHRDHTHTAGQMEAAADEIDRLRALLVQAGMDPSA